MQQSRAVVSAENAAIANESMAFGGTYGDEKLDQLGAIEMSSVENKKSLFVALRKRLHRF